MSRPSFPSRPLLALVCALALAPAASCGDGAGPPPELDFTAFDTALEAFILEHDLEGANVVIVHRDWGVMHQRAYGSFAPDRISLLASASKILSVGVIMRLHDQGILDIDAPISTYAPVTSPDVMGWTGSRSFTLAQMLSNSSGMVGLVDDPMYAPYLCQYAFLGTLQSCGRNIYQADDAADIVPPDTEFHYGGGQWQLAGAIAELASGKTWAQLVQETYADPCELGTLAYTNQFASTSWLGRMRSRRRLPTVAWTRRWATPASSTETSRCCPSPATRAWRAAATPRWPTTARCCSCTCVAACAATASAC